jgi:hypothetical protein
LTQPLPRSLSSRELPVAQTLVLPETPQISPFQRCGHPGQQHGRRIPSFNSERIRSTCCLLVSGFFTDITQQIHSFRASGVMSSHFSRAAGSDISALRKSAGTL